MHIHINGARVRARGFRRPSRAGERASASGLSSREKYGALSLTLNVSAKRGGDGGAAQRNAVAREARRRAGSPAPAPAVCCCPASCLVPLYPSQSRLPSSENASSPSPSPSPPFPFSLSPSRPIRSPHYSKVARMFKTLSLAMHCSKGTNDCG